MAAISRASSGASDRVHLDPEKFGSDVAMNTLRSSARAAAGEAASAAGVAAAAAGAGVDRISAEVMTLTASWPSEGAAYFAAMGGGSSKLDAAATVTTAELTTQDSENAADIRSVTVRSV